MKYPNFGDDNALVRKSASCSFVEIGSSFKTPFCNFSLIKWQSISRCLVLSWNTGLEAMCIALWLSQYKTGGLLQVAFKSCKRYNNHCSSQTAEARDLYSASDEDLATVCYFLALHEMSDFPIKKQYPEVDLLVSTHPAQSASAYPKSCISESLGNKRP
jgi:hypothetical protein